MDDLEKLRRSGKFSQNAKFMEMSASCEVNVTELLQQFLFSGGNKEMSRKEQEEVQNELHS